MSLHKAALFDDISLILTFTSHFYHVYVLIHLNYILVSFFIRFFSVIKKKFIIILYFF